MNILEAGKRQIGQNLAAQTASADNQNLGLISQKVFNLDAVRMVLKCKSLNHVHHHQLGMLDLFEDPECSRPDLCDSICLASLQRRQIQQPFSSSGISMRQWSRSESKQADRVYHVSIHHFLRATTCPNPFISVVINTSEVVWYCQY